MSMLKERVRDVQKRVPQDIDPEDEPSHYRNDTDSGEDDNKPSGGREHYEDVDISRLRKPERPELDKKYSGVAVSRAEFEDDDQDPFAPVEDDEEDDPFAARGEADDPSQLGALQEHEESENHSETSSKDGSQPPIQTTEDLPALRVRNSARDKDMSNVDDDDDDDDDDYDHDSQGWVDDDEESEDSDTSMEDVTERPSEISSHRMDMKKLLMGNAAESAIVSSLSASATDQTRKGAAVQQQQDTLDRLLDSRIKLQKALTASNELDAEDQLNDDVQAAASKAEAAAISLWSTIDAIRCDTLAHHQSSQPRTKKRKIEALEPASKTPLSTLKAHAQDLESAVLPTRHAMLNHWYSRTRPAAASTSRSALSIQPDNSTISSVLTTYLSTNLSKLATSAQSSANTFDDTPFYQSLLTALIASRTNAASVSSSLPSSTLPATKNPKIKKNVDTKASKGRKIRYTVHEKLQNFMAPEDRTTWTEEGRREFFGSLLGQVLAETEGQAEIDDDDDDKNETDEVGALRLFGGNGVAV